MPISLSNVRFRYDPELQLQDLPHDVFSSLCKHIDHNSMVTIRSALQRLDRNNEEWNDMRAGNNRYDLQKMIFILGDKGGWTVRDIAKVLLRTNNKLALRRILCFWPPRIVKRPPTEIHIYSGEVLDLSVEVSGYPDPKITWYNSNNEEVGRGSHLQLSGQIQSGRYHVIARSRDPVDDSELNDTAFSCVTYHPVPPGPTRNPTYEHCGSESTMSLCSDAPSSMSLTTNSMRFFQSQESFLYRMDLPTPIEVSKSSSGAVGKVALLVGMGTYQSSCYATLAGPSQDLIDLATLLARVNFRVFTLRDLSLDDLNKAINIYADLLNPGVYGVLYLSGHGVRFPGKNDDFLLPVDAPAEKTIQHCLSRKKVIGALQRRRPDFNLVIWDACRQKAQFPSTQNEETNPGEDFIYGESNLFEFRSSVAFTQSFEYNKRSLIILRLLEILGDMSKKMNIAELLTTWKGAVEASGYQTPAIMLGGSSQLSLWDPIIRRNGQTQQFFRILRLWSDGYALDEKQVFPKLTFSVNCVPGAGINIIYVFRLHNVLYLQIKSVDNTKAIQYLFDIVKVQEAVSPCSVHHEGNINRFNEREVCEAISIRNIERLARSQQSAHVSLPFCMLSFTSEGQVVAQYHELIIKHIRLIELFQQDI